MTKIVKKIKHGLVGPAGQAAIRWLWLIPLVMMIWTVVAFAVQTTGLHGRVHKSIGRYLAMEKELSSAMPAKNDALEAMKNKSLFAPPASPPEMPQCLGILGKFVLLNGEWYKVGDEVGGAKILAVGPTDVKILWQEKEETLTPFDVQVEYSGGGGGGGRGRPEASRDSSGQQPQPAAEFRPEPPRDGPPFMGRGGFDFRRMSPEELGRMRDRFMNMSPEEQRAAYEEMRRNRSR